MPLVIKACLNQSVLSSLCICWRLPRPCTRLVSCIVRYISMFCRFVCRRFFLRIICIVLQCGAGQKFFHTAAVSCSEIFHFNFNLISIRCFWFLFSESQFHPCMFLLRHSNDFDGDDAQWGEWNAQPLDAGWAGKVLNLQSTVDWHLFRHFIIHCQECSFEPFCKKQLESQSLLSGICLFLFFPCQGLALHNFRFAIDTSLYPPNIQFIGDLSALLSSPSESQDLLRCPEMMQHQPWSIQQDGFGLAACIHMMMHGGQGGSFEAVHQEMLVCDPDQQNEIVMLRWASKTPVRAYVCCASACHLE